MFLTHACLTLLFFPPRKVLISGEASSHWANRRSADLDLDGLIFSPSPPMRRDASFSWGAGDVGGQSHLTFHPRVIVCSTLNSTEIGFWITWWKVFPGNECKLVCAPRRLWGFTAVRSVCWRLGGSVDKGPTLWWKGTPRAQSGSTSSSFLVTCIHFPFFPFHWERKGVPARPTCCYTFSLTACCRDLPLGNWKLC